MNTSSLLVKSEFMLWSLADIINMEDGKPALAVWPETRIYTLAHSVSHPMSISQLELFRLQVGLIFLVISGTQEEAAEAYDVAAIKFRGVNAVTNFDISKYDVERIMESNGLISGELARRSKDVPPCNDTALNNILQPRINMEAIASKDNSSSSNVPDWRMGLYQSTHDDKPGSDDFKDANFSVPIHEMIASGQQNADASGKMASHLSTGSPLMTTSLSCSREGSPDKNIVLPMQFALPPPLGSKFFPCTTSSGSNTTAWIPVAAAQMRPQVPLFSAWTDAS